MENNQRHIVHLDLDTFFVSVERQQNSALEGKPVIIGGGSERGVVSACSYEARRYGVHSAMPMRMARQLCADAIYIRGDMELYSKYSHLVTSIIADKAPVYEKASIDEHYLDLTGMDRFYGCQKWAHELRQTIIKESGLPISMGHSINKTVSKIATGEAKPCGEKEVVAPMVQPFLNPLSIRKIPMLGAKTYHLLRSMGIEKIETLSRIPPEMIQQVLGKNGLDIWKKANGIDLTPIERYQEQKSMSSERTFEQDTTDVRFLNDCLTRMAEKLAFELRQQQKLTACITVKIRYANYDTHTIQQKIAYTAFDHTIIHTARELFQRLYTRRMLVRLVGIRLSNLVGGVQQLNLFEDTPEQIRLYMAMDRIRNRFGAKVLHRAAGCW